MRSGLNLVFVEVKCVEWVAFMCGITSGVGEEEVFPNCSFSRTSSLMQQAFPLLIEKSWHLVGEYSSHVGVSLRILSRTGLLGDQR